MLDFKGEKYASLAEVRKFINDSMIEFIGLNEKQKRPLDKKELTGFRAFHKLLIEQLELAEKIENV